MRKLSVSNYPGSTELSISHLSRQGGLKSWSYFILDTNQESVIIFEAILMTPRCEPRREQTDRLHIGPPNALFNILHK